MITIIKDQKNISETLGVSSERADWMFAMICSYFFLSISNEEPVQFDYILENSLKSIDQDNQAEIFYLGMKISEIVEITYNQTSAIILYNKIAREVKDSRNIDDMISLILPIIGAK